MDGKLVLLGVLVLIVLCIGVAGGVFESMLMPDYTTDEIRMVQPNGWSPRRDAAYAQGVNLPNSEANKNNGQAEVYEAQADAIRMTANAPAYAAQNLGSGIGCGLGGVLLGLAAFGYLYLSKA